MKTDKINIAIVDDHPIVIEGLKLLLSSETAIHISGTFVDGNGILSFIKTNEVDVILLDITLPDSNGIELCRELKNSAPNTAVLMLSNRSERSMIMQSLQNGASGYLLKNASLEELTKAIKDVVHGNIVFCNEVRKIISKPVKNELDGLPKLTKRETQILKMLAEGNTSAMIASELCLSTLTVDTHRKNIMHKCKAKNVAELVTIATQHNMV